MPIEAVFNNDIVGNSLGGNGIRRRRVDQGLRGRPGGFAGAIAGASHRKTAAVYVPSHRVRPDGARGSVRPRQRSVVVHARGSPAIVFREANENFAKQHGADDTIDGVDFGYLAQNARVNAAGVASLALAPPAPKVTNDRGGNMLSRDPSGYDATMRWNASPGAVAYRIYWRDTWSNDWQHSQTIGNVTQFTLEERLDRRLRVRRVGDRRGRQREPGQRVRIAGAARSAAEEVIRELPARVRRLGSRRCAPPIGLRRLRASRRRPRASNWRTRLGARLTAS